jgi:putative peptide zinc metalloprotease protein
MAHGWLYSSHGVTAGLYQVIFSPGLVLAVLALLVLSNVVHEFGHATALRYGGGRAREMGVALYLIYPAFYTDTTESYRLGRWARVRTDLGGFYFHLIFASIIVGIYLLLRQEWLLVVVFLIDLDVLYQLVPFVRFDGYWTLADLTGIPDLLSQIGPFVRSMLPFRRFKDQRLPALKLWVRIAFSLYLAITVPVLSVLIALMVSHLPQFVTTMWASAELQARALSSAWRIRDSAAAALAMVQLTLLLLEAVGALYLLASAGRLGWRAIRGWRSGAAAQGAANLLETA